MYKIPVYTVTDTFSKSLLSTILLKALNRLLAVGVEVSPSKPLMLYAHGIGFSTGLAIHDISTDKFESYRVIICDLETNDISLTCDVTYEKENECISDLMTSVEKFQNIISHLTMVRGLENAVELITSTHIEGLAKAAEKERAKANSKKDI